MQESRNRCAQEGEVMTEMRRVTAIRNGTVVDHIPSGNAMQVIRILRIDTDRATPVSLVMNVPSDKLGRKDVLKIEDRELDQEDLDRLALIALRILTYCAEGGAMCTLENPYSGLLEERSSMQEHRHRR